MRFIWRFCMIMLSMIYASVVIFVVNENDNSAFKVTVATITFAVVGLSLWITIPPPAVSDYSVNWFMSDYRSSLSRSEYQGQIGGIARTGPLREVDRTDMLDAMIDFFEPDTETAYETINRALDKEYGPDPNAY